MNIHNEIDVDLWETIRKNYEAENFSGAILDGVFKLTDTIRNKTGLEGDGASLIGQAFGGEIPKIKLNKLQTDSEKDVQKGIQEILRGIYTAIRNPRSHDAIHDKKSDADAVIVFINYLLSLIDESKSSFEKEDFLKRVFDKYYVKTVEYSNLLVLEIPARQRADIAISTILRRNEGDTFKLKYFMVALLSHLNEPELLRVYKVISEELKTATDESDISSLIHIIPAGLWDKVEKTVRLRIETLLFESFCIGRYDEHENECLVGELATWVTAEHLKHFNRLSDWTREAIQSFQNKNGYKSAYINKYFWGKLCEANRDKITTPMRDYFKTGLLEGKQIVIDKLKDIIIWDKDHPWWKEFEEELSMHPDIECIEDLELPF